MSPGSAGPCSAPIASKRLGPGRGPPIQRFPVCAGSLAAAPLLCLGYMAYYIGGVRVWFAPTTLWLSGRGQPQRRAKRYPGSGPMLGPHRIRGRGVWASAHLLCGFRALVILTAGPPVHGRAPVNRSGSECVVGGAGLHPRLGPTQITTGGMQLGRSSDVLWHNGQRQIPK
ncbi:hypothetical protein NDU88_004297 [Pleurodeles waltl]|uniref:Uncharacterized protein n=1 Tax=Pleurodeles waltl TaxID=8319 RepID=A0AAV7MDN5_PLEWA|nr:hypothetical protein NDU88_004297 [Pleurodeles waltl]